MSLELNWQLMLLVFVTFMLLILILNTWLYRPILELIQRRDALLGEDAKGIEEQKKEIAQLKLEAEEVLRHARAEAKKIKDLATLEAQGVFEEKLNRSKSEISNRFVNSQKELDERRAQIREELAKNASIFEEEVKAKFLSLGGCK